MVAKKIKRLWMVLDSANEKFGVWTGPNKTS